jgi:hypothetical protein
VEGVSVIAMLAVACLIYVVSLSGAKQDNNSSV